MKFRTDFVTNSSDSSFLVFHVENKKLYDYLESLGIKIMQTEDGVLSDRMIITLPSGESCDIDGINNWNYPFLSDCNSVTAWLFGLLLWEFEEGLEQEEDEYSSFTKELFQILHDEDLLHHDWEEVEELTRDDIAGDLNALHSYDFAMTSAEIDQAYAFEGEIQRATRYRIKDGRMDKESFDCYCSDLESDEVSGDELWEAMFCGDNKKLFDLAKKADLTEKEVKVLNDDGIWEDFAE